MVTHGYSILSVCDIFDGVSDVRRGVSGLGTSSAARCTSPARAVRGLRGDLEATPRGRHRDASRPSRRLRLRRRRRHARHGRRRRRLRSLSIRRFQIPGRYMHFMRSLQDFQASDSLLAALLTAYALASLMV